MHSRQPSDTRVTLSRGIEFLARPPWIRANAKNKKATKTRLNCRLYFWPSWCTLPFPLSLSLSLLFASPSLLLLLLSRSRSTLAEMTGLFKRRTFPSLLLVPRCCSPYAIAVSDLSALRSPPINPVSAPVRKFVTRVTRLLFVRTKTTESRNELKKKNEWV